jgi:hypothetical protein
MNEPQAKRMHESALRVLGVYESTGEPFSLFLSSFSIDEAHAIIDDILGRGPRNAPRPRNVQLRIGIERQVRILLQRDKLESVSALRREDSERIAVPDEWPALTLEDDEWLARVEQIVQWADLIVLFWGVSTPGLMQEVEICASDSNALKTVVITPAAPRDIFLSGICQTFPRIVPLTEIPPFFALHPEFTPLIDRMKAIKEVDPDVRSKFIEPKERLKRFPLPPISGRFDKPIWIEHSP